MPKNVELRIPFDPMPHKQFVQPIRSVHASLASADECYTAYAFLCLSGVWANIKYHTSDSLRLVHFTCLPHNLEEVEETHGEETAQMPYNRKQTTVVPVSHVSASITPKTLHSLFQLVGAAEPISLAFVASDGTVTVNKIYNFPKAPDTRPSNERKEMLEQERVPGVQAADATQPDPNGEEGEEIMQHDGQQGDLDSAGKRSCAGDDYNVGKEMHQADAVVADAQKA